MKIKLSALIIASVFVDDIIGQTVAYFFSCKKLSLAAVFIIRAVPFGNKADLEEQNERWAVMWDVIRDNSKIFFLNLNYVSGTVNKENSPSKCISQHFVWLHSPSTGHVSSYRHRF